MTPPIRSRSPGLSAAAGARRTSGGRTAARRLPSDLRQREIVATVLALARDVGPDAITTQAIADRMGVTQGAVFRHFPDKASIWLAVFAFVRAGLEQALASALAQPRGPLAQLEAAFTAHVAFIAAHPGVPRVLYHELQLPDDSPVRAEVRRMIGAYRARLARLFRAARSAGELPPGLDPGLAAVLFIGAVQGLVIDAALAGNDAAMQKRARPMFQLLLDGYRAGRMSPTGVPAADYGSARGEATPAGATDEAGSAQRASTPGSVPRGEEAP